MSKEQEFMNLEQIADVVMDTDSVIKLGVTGTLSFALFYEYAKSPNVAHLESDFKSIQQGLANAQTRINHPEQVAYLGKINKLVSQFEQAAKNPYDQNSIEFMARAQTVLRARYAKEPNERYAISNIKPDDAEQYIMLLLSRLHLIKDERIKYNVLGFFSANPNGQLTESARQVFIMRANSVHATTRDLYYLMIMQSNMGADVRTVFQDMEAIARRDLTAEIAKEAPDIQKMTDIINLIHYGAAITKDTAIIQQVRQVYDLKKLLMPNAEEYISKAPDAHTQKIAELESQIDNLKQQVNEKTAEVHRLGRELDETKRTLTDAQAQNQTLNSENSALRQENSSLGLEKSSSETKLQKLIAGARQIKSGLGSRGVNEYKQMVEEMESGSMSL